MHANGINLDGRFREFEVIACLPARLGRVKVIDLGFHTPYLPVEVGGGGLDNPTFALFEREFGRV